MTSIPVAISRFSDNKFKRLYLKKKETFLRFFIEFLKYPWNLEHFEIKEEYPSVVLPKLLFPKEMFT